MNLEGNKKNNYHHFFTKLLQHPNRPVIIPIITRNSQIRDTFNTFMEIRTT